MKNIKERRNSSLQALTMAVGIIPKVKGVNEQGQEQVTKRFSSSTQSTASLRSSFSGDYCDNDDWQCYFFQSRADEDEDEEEYFDYYGSGSLKLLNACRIRQAQHDQQKTNERKSSSYLTDAAILTGSNQISPGVRDSSVAPPDQLQVQLDKEITIDDAVKSIVNSSDSWAKVKERIRSRNLVTNQGVFEVCLSYFQEEVDRLKKERMDEARKAEAQLSKISRLRRRLSLF
mmetsp:Transcript_4241/g.5205  ORF Transcript_4241/g.5205 Transcript_4241/m.5205 type:complete len:231 (-) Transcript_4241:112-804(-)